MNKKRIKIESNFDYIKLLIPNLMLSLRHIWIISEHFRQENNMECLIRNISYIFTEKVKEIVKLNTIFKSSALNAYILATKCADLLITWKESYLQLRTYIEKSGVGSRWEFKKKFLFDDLDHCARISNDIASISMIFVEFENIFKRKIQSMVYNSDNVDNIINKVSKYVTLTLANVIQ